MKKILGTLFGIAGGVLVASAAVAFTPPNDYTPGSGINGTPHDLGTAHHGMNYTASPSDAPLNRICIFCHAPHNTYRLIDSPDGAVGPVVPDSTFDYLPLWNHTLQSDWVYTMYDNGSGAPTFGPQASQARMLELMTTPGSVSLLCLSCHDGSVAVNSYGNDDQRSGSKSTGTNTIVSSYAIGAAKYLGNHHPISFNYDAVQAVDNVAIRSADDYNLTPTSSVREHLYGPAGGSLECATCHSVHNTGNGGEALLWRSDQNSELCLTCHNKGFYTPPVGP